MEYLVDYERPGKTDFEMFQMETEALAAPRKKHFEIVRDLDHEAGFEMPRLPADELVGFESGIAAVAAT